MTNKIDLTIENILKNEMEFKKFINTMKSDEDRMKEFSSIAIQYLYESKPKQIVEVLNESGYVKNDTVIIEDREFYGLRASVNLDINAIKCDEDVLDIVDMIIDLEIKPSRLFIKRDRIDIFYQPQKEINVESKSGYMNLVNEFIDFIKSQELIEMKFLGWDLNGEKIIEAQSSDSKVLLSKEIFNPDTVYVDGLIEGYITL